MISTSNKHQLQLVLQTFEKKTQLSIHKAIRLYNVLHSTLSYRINGHSAYIYTMVNS